MQLLPCPFCGQPFQDCSFDRGVLFKCNSCNYSRSFPGILQTIDNGISCGNGLEYYHADAKDKAIEEMNKRAGVNEALSIVKELAQWSEKYPRGRTYSFNAKVDEQLIEIEEKAKGLFEPTKEVNQP